VFILSSYREAVAQNFIVDNEVKDFINREDRDFRVCTSCSGPVLVPLDMARAKPSDIEIKVGDNTLFVSIVMARYTRRIHKSMLDQYLWFLENGQRCELD
jgi:hypothetical protein